MSRSPKFSLFRPLTEPSPLRKTNGDGLGSTRLNDGDASEERKANIKLAWFFSTVAVLFVLADQLGHVKNAFDANSGPASAASVSLTLSPREGPRDRAAFSVRFLLSNRGNHSVFYPVRAGTGAPVGQTVARTSPTSDWVTSSSASKQPVTDAQEFMDPNYRWIEMPPGGWVDGEFRDTVEFPGEHAYVIYVKPARDAYGGRIISQPYTSSAH